MLDLCQNSLLALDGIDVDITITSIFITLKEHI